LSVITISRQRGSYGNEIAAALAQKLGFELITHETWLSMFLDDSVASPHERHMLSESAKFYLTASQTGDTFLELLSQRLRSLTRTHNAVLVGFGSQAILAGDDSALHVRVFAPDDVRIARLKKQYHVSDAQAEQILSKADKKQKKFVHTLFGVSIAEPSQYHLTLNTACLGVDECVAAIMALHEKHALKQRIEQHADHLSAQPNMSGLTVLKNASEIEFARLLNMYQIEWVYEPKTFPIEWDAGGNVISAFSPDFYLPKFDTYIELTTMNQKYVTDKNKKVKKLRELYPGINIKVVYKKDFHSLAERFNLNGD
jgi:cytidylate kinase